MSEEAPVAAAASIPESVTAPVETPAAATENISENVPRSESSSVKQSSVPGGLVGSNLSKIASTDASFHQAKSYLLKTSPLSHLNLYDHLTSCVAQLLEERPENPVDAFENLSSAVKQAKLKTASSTDPVGLRSAKIPTSVLNASKKEVELFNISAEASVGDSASATSAELPDMFDIFRLLEWANVGLSQEQVFRLFVSVRNLTAQNALKSVRFFGRIDGIQKAYYIVEAEITAETPVPSEESPASAATALELTSSDQQPNFDPASGLDASVPEQAQLLENLPKPKPTVDIKAIQLPLEEGSGVNRYVYYVSNNVDGPWTRLPNANPNLVQASRKIRKAFTGNLTTPITSYPVFQGSEADYLRSQIARIAAATVISPSGYYTFEKEEDAEEGEATASNNIVMNLEFESQAPEELLQPGAWVHHQAFVLPQGRTSWVNPMSSQPTKEGDEEGGDEKGSNDGEGNDGENGEDGGEASHLEPEVGPVLLTSIEQDDEVEPGIPAWSIRLGSARLPSKFAPVYARSNRWPGAVSVTYQKKFANVYVGDGLKYEPKWQLPNLPPIKMEYGIKVEKKEPTEDQPQPPSDQISYQFPTDVVELADPTLEDEKAFEESKKAKEEEKEEANSGDKDDEGDAEDNE